MIQLTPNIFEFTVLSLLTRQIVGPPIMSLYLRIARIRICKLRFLQWKRVEYLTIVGQIDCLRSHLNAVLLLFVLRLFTLRLHLDFSLKRCLEHIDLMFHFPNSNRKNPHRHKKEGDRENSLHRSLPCAHTFRNLLVIHNSKSVLNFQQKRCLIQIGETLLLCLF